MDRKLRLLRGSSGLFARSVALNVVILGVCRKYHARRQIFAWLRVVTSIAPQCAVHGRDSFQRGLEVDFFWQGRKAAKFTSFLPSGGCRNPTIAEKLQ